MEEAILVPTSTAHTITWFNNGSGIMASMKLYSRSYPSIIETDLSNAQASRQSHMAIPLDRFFFDRQPKPCRHSIGFGCDKDVVHLSLTRRTCKQLELREYDEMPFL